MRAAQVSVLVATLVAMVAAACDRPGIAQRGRDPGSLVVAHAADIQALDLAIVTDNESIEVCGLMFEGLVRWKPGTTDILPGLATSWQPSPDGKRWTFQLRPGVTFHDGTPFDAAAVKFSFERLLDPAHPYYLKEGDHWRSLLRDVVEVVPLAPTIVEIRVARPYAPLLGDLAMYPMVSPKAVAKHGKEFKLNPVGTGPFQFESWTPGDSVVVRRYGGYWGPPAILQRVVFRVVVDARQRLVNLESGSVDLATAILPNEQPFVDLHPDLVLHHAPGNNVSYLAFNMQHPPFDDVRVRRAVAYAINKEPIVKLAFQGRAVPADGPLPPTQWGYHLPKARYAFDQARAKALLAEATADRKFDPLRRYTLRAMSTPRPYLPSPEHVARFLQASLEQIGIRTELVLEPYLVHRTAIQAGEHDLALFGWVGDTGDPDNFLYVLFHSSNANPPGARNVAFYRDPDVDRMLVEAQGAIDEATRTERYHAIQDKLAEDAPWVPIAHSELVVAARSELEGLVLSPLGHPIYALIRRGDRR